MCVVYSIRQGPICFLVKFSSHSQTFCLADACLIADWDTKIDARSVGKFNLHIRQKLNLSICS